MYEEGEQEFTTITHWFSKGLFWSWSWALLAVAAPQWRTNIRAQGLGQLWGLESRFHQQPDFTSVTEIKRKMWHNLSCHVHGLDSLFRGNFGQYDVMATFLPRMRLELLILHQKHLCFIQMALAILQTSEICKLAPWQVFQQWGLFQLLSSSRGLTRATKPKTSSLTYKSLSAPFSKICESSSIRTPF